MTDHQVLLIGPWPPPYGGPNVHMTHLRRRLEAAGATVRVLNIGPSRKVAVEGAIPAPSAMDVLRVTIASARAGSRIHHYFNVDSWKAVALALLVSIVARSFGGTYSVGFIGGTDQYYLRHRSSPWSLALRGILRLSSLTICNNSAVRFVLVSLGSAPSRTHAIQAFHADQVCDMASPPTQIAEFLTTHRPVLTSVILPRHESGRPYHEVELLTAAVAELAPIFPEIGCVVMGSAAERAIYEALAAAAGVRSCFLFAGEVPHPACLGTIAASQVFVRASMRDGSSSSVREALALGIPTVASRNPHHPPQAQQFLTLDVPDLVRVLSRVLTDSRSEPSEPQPEVPVGGDMGREVRLLLRLAE